MAESYSWMITSPVTSYCDRYGSLPTTNPSTRSFYFPDDVSAAAAGSRCGAHCACTADDRLPVNSSREHYYGQLPRQQQQQHQQQQLGWFSVGNVLMPPLNVGSTTTAMTTNANAATTYLSAYRDDDTAGKPVHT